MASGSEKSNGMRMEESKKMAMNETLVGSERWVVKSPIAEIIGGAVSVPFLDWKVSGNLHPMPLSLVISKLWRVGSTRVRVQ